MRRGMRRRQFKKEPTATEPQLYFSRLERPMQLLRVYFPRQYQSTACPEMMKINASFRNLVPHSN